MIKSGPGSGESSERGSPNFFKRNMSYGLSLETRES